MTPNTSAHRSVDGREVTHADQKAAELTCAIVAARITRSDLIGLSSEIAQAFARHRITSTAALQGRIAELEAALKPFADDLYPGDDWGDDLAGPETMATAGMVRRARATLTKGATA